ncbi:MAG: UDP-2,3-diacylglucosamine diphosphatase [Flavobacteriales bacterium]
MKKENKRSVDLVVISDLHLGTYGCRADELLNYLRSIKPKVLVLNGDIIDMWQFSKHYFPSSHMKVIKYITSLLAKGTTVHYITGNHDEMLRKFAGYQLGGLHIANKLVLELDGLRTWFFHGDVFDVTMRHSRWLAKLGGKGYDSLIVLNAMVNRASKAFGGGRFSFSKRIKNGVKGALKHISDFEGTAARFASDAGYRIVVCGHIHQPALRVINVGQEEPVVYMNSGDWVENMTALEFTGNTWSLYSYLEDKDLHARLYGAQDEEGIELEKVTSTRDVLFEDLLKEFSAPKFNAV